MSKRTHHAHLTTSRVGLFQLIDTLVRDLAAPNELDAPPHTDRLSFVHDTRVDHAPTDISECSTAPNKPNLALAAPLLGVVGCESPLPFDMTESVLAADDGGATSSFLDTFHGRAMQLVHAAWKALGPHGTDALRAGLRSFVGDDAFAADADRSSAEELFGLGVSDVVRCNPEYVGEAGLEALLGRAFPELHARVAAGAGVFVDQAAAETSPLGVGRNRLGAGATYGRGTWNPVVTLRISTREMGDVAPLLPGGQTYGNLAAFCARWIPGCRNVELDVPLPGERATWTRLGSTAGARLGFDSQITQKRPDRVRMRVKVVSSSGRMEVRYVADE